jgi:PleD family two-component response regulator
MKIIVKTLNGKQLPLDVESDWTVRRLKEQMESVHDLKADTLKLIAYGKVLDKDENPISTYKIKEGDFLVAMVQKVKPAKAAPKANPSEEAKKEEPSAATQPVASNPSAQTQPAAENEPVVSTAPPMSMPVAG